MEDITIHIHTLASMADGSNRISNENSSRKIIKNKTIFILKPRANKYYTLKLDPQTSNTDLHRKINLMTFPECHDGTKIQTSNNNNICKVKRKKVYRYKNKRFLKLPSLLSSTTASHKNLRSRVRSMPNLNVLSICKNSFRSNRPDKLNDFKSKHPIMKTHLKVYRCQINTKEDVCCCSCNSDAMFEVMKSLYDCYKKKNCNNCNCILCGHEAKEYRKIHTEKSKAKEAGMSTQTPKEIHEERFTKAKEAGLLSPLEGKSLKKKEQTLKGLAMQGIALPEGKSPSERELTQKVRGDLGLLPSLKSSADKQKYKIAENTGLLTAIEGKKIKSRATTIQSEKLRKAQEAGLLTPLVGKSDDEKEKIFKGLAMQGLPLPEGKTTSEKGIIQKVRKDLGLPPEPKTKSEKSKLSKAIANGLVVPLEGKNTKQKEEILKRIAEAGIELPKGRTPSEENLVKTIRTKFQPSEAEVPERYRKLDIETAKKMKEGKGPSDECICGLLTGKAKIKTKAKKRKLSLRKAKDDGLLTPLDGKSLEQKEKILRGLVKASIPLPEPKTSSERALFSKVRRDLGLPPEPTTESVRDKYRMAETTGIITPLEGKTLPEKEAILKKLHSAGIPLPEGRSKSEKSLVKKITGQAIRSTTKIPLPPEPRTRSEKNKLDRAITSGIITPLQGKTREEKEKALKRMAKAGIALPEGKTSSEKALVQKIQAEMSPQFKVPSDRIRAAKDAGLLTPLEGKSKEQKVKILKGLAAFGMPLPEGQTLSDKDLVKKVKHDIGLPPEPKSRSQKLKVDRAFAAGLITPLEGKTMQQKERVLRRLADTGVDLPAGRTRSEKVLIEKIRSEVPQKAKITSEKIRAAKAAGLLSPLEGKTQEQKERILRGLVKEGLPLPESKTASEEILLKKIRKEMGLPPKPKTPSEQRKMDKAFAAGLITPLEGKTPAQKKEILQRLVDAEIALPEGRTTSEKTLIHKIRKETSSKEKVTAAKLRAAKSAGLLTPLEGKTMQQKENILKGLIKSGMPLPEPKTMSEKLLVSKVKKEMGKPEPKTRSGIITPLEGKTRAGKEQALKPLAKTEVLLPSGRTSSEKSLLKKTQGKAISKYKVPSEKIIAAKEAGLLTPLEGKNKTQKEKILRGLAKLGLPLPEGKTSSEKLLIKKVRKDMGLPPEPRTRSERSKLDKAVATGLVIPLQGKSSAEKEEIIRNLAHVGVELPEGRTLSEKKLITKIKGESKSTPLLKKVIELERKTAKNMSGSKGPSDECICSILAPAVALHETKKPSSLTPPEKVRTAKAAGLLTPLKGKDQKQKENILKGLVKSGMPLPEPKTTSEKLLIGKVRKEMGLPSEPKTTSEKDRLDRAFTAGIITPLEGKTRAEKEQILKRMAEAGVTLPEGRTSSEKSLIKKIYSETTPKFGVPSAKMRAAKAAGLLTPLEGKTKEQKEKNLRGLAASGMPLPEGKNQSEKNLIKKVRHDLGLPPEPKSKSQKLKMDSAFAAGLVTPLEGKTTDQKYTVLKRLADAGVELPDGRTPSEKALINKVHAELPQKVKITSEKFRDAKAAGLMSPLEGKTSLQKESILRGLAQAGLPLPEGKTMSEKNIITKVRKEMGLPPEPNTKSEKNRMDKAFAAGIVTPLEGKSSDQKERILQQLATAGIPLPEGRTRSEKILIKKIQSKLSSTDKIHKEKIQAARAAGLITPLEGKTSKQRERILRGLAESGLPLPEGKSTSEKNIIQKVRNDLGLPPEPKSNSEKRRLDKAYAAGIVEPLSGKNNNEKAKILKRLAEAGISLPDGKTPSEKALIKRIRLEVSPIARMSSENMRAAKAAGLLTPLEGKSPQQKEEILKKLAISGLPLPEGKSMSDKKLINKIVRDMGLPPRPKTKSEKIRMDNAVAAGIVLPLEGKNSEEKEKILRNLVDAGIPLPEPRTESEQKVINKIVNLKEQRREVAAPPVLSPKVKKLDKKSAKVMKEGKGPSDECICNILAPQIQLDAEKTEEKKQMLKNIVNTGKPLPKGKTASEVDLIQKVRQEMGLPPEPRSQSERFKLDRATAEGIVTPLNGKKNEEKEKILKRLAQAGITLPEGRSRSEKSLIKKIQKEVQPLPIAKSEKLGAAQAAGILTPLQGKTSAQKEQILRGLAKAGLPLPDAQTRSEKDLKNKVIFEMGLPTEPKSRSEKIKFDKAVAQGIITPLEGKTLAQKEKVLKRLVEAGVNLPEGRTRSERSIINKIVAEVKPIPKITSNKLRAAGVLTPLEGKTPEQKEQILKGLAKAGLPLPDGKTASDKKLIKNVIYEMGLPPQPKLLSEKVRLDKAIAEGIVTPLEGKNIKEKENALQRMAKAGVTLPVARTPSEKALIQKVQAESKVKKSESEKNRASKLAGILTPLEGKTEEQKEQIIRGLIKSRMPLPDAKSNTEKIIIKKVIKDMGLPPEPRSRSEKKRMNKALAAGLITPLEGKSSTEKEQILRNLANAGIVLPEPRTTSEKKLIKKIKEEVQEAKHTPKMSKNAIELDRKTAKLIKEGKGPSDECICNIISPVTGLSGIHLPSDKLHAAKSAGFLTPLDGKSANEKERILRGLAESGLPLPEAKTESEKNLISSIRKEIGLPPNPKTDSQKQRMFKAYAAGLITPLEGKSSTQKEKIIRKLAEAGVELPDGRSRSEKSMIRKIRTEVGVARESKTPTEKEVIRKLRVESKLSKERTSIPTDHRQQIKTKTRKIGVSGTGIAEEFEDIIKTTTCDRGCGCDKKKIRFKHSYVKIRVTSPDFSSLCPCPEECVPQVKHGVIADNEGIRVTVGTALLHPTCKDKSHPYLRNILSCEVGEEKFEDKYHFDISDNDYNVNDVVYLMKRSYSTNSGDKNQPNLSRYIDECVNLHAENTLHLHSDVSDVNTGSNDSIDSGHTMKSFTWLKILNSDQLLMSQQFDSSFTQCNSSLQWLAKTESSLCLNSIATSDNVCFSFSVSNLQSYMSSKSLQFEVNNNKENLEIKNIYSTSVSNHFSKTNCENRSFLNKEIDEDCSTISIIYPYSKNNKIVQRHHEFPDYNMQIYEYALSNTEVKKSSNNIYLSDSRDIPCNILKNTNCTNNNGEVDLDVVRHIISAKGITNTMSSVYIIITSDYEEEDLSSPSNDVSRIGIEIHSDIEDYVQQLRMPCRSNFITRGLKISGRSGMFCLGRLPDVVSPEPCIDIEDSDCQFTNEWSPLHIVDKRNITLQELQPCMSNSDLQSLPRTDSPRIRFSMIDICTDTTNRPCCCNKEDTELNMPEAQNYDCYDPDIGMGSTHSRNQAIQKESSRTRVRQPHYKSGGDTSSLTSRECRCQRWIPMQSQDKERLHKHTRHNKLSPQQSSYKQVSPKHSRHKQLSPMQSRHKQPIPKQSHHKRSHHKRSRQKRSRHKKLSPMHSRHKKPRHKILSPQNSQFKQLPPEQSRHDQCNSCNVKGKQTRNENLRSTSKEQLKSCGSDYDFCFKTNQKRDAECQSCLNNSYTKKLKKSRKKYKNEKDVDKHLENYADIKSHNNIEKKKENKTRNKTDPEHRKRPTRDELRAIKEFDLVHINKSKNTDDLCQSPVEALLKFKDLEYRNRLYSELQSIKSKYSTDVPDLTATKHTNRVNCHPNPSGTTMHLEIFTLDQSCSCKLK